MRLKGEWREGAFVEGEWVLENGNKFLGKFENGKPSGEGVWVLAGERVEGFYRQREGKVEEEAKPKIKNQFLIQTKEKIETEWVSK